MTLWIIVGSIVWTLCVLLMLAIFKGGHRIRGHGYEQKTIFQKRSEEDYKNKKESMSTHICP